MAALARAGARFATQPLRGPACAVALVGDVGSAADPTSPTSATAQAGPLSGWVAKRAPARARAAMLLLELRLL